MLKNKPVFNSICSCLPGEVKLACTDPLALHFSAVTNSLEQKNTWLGQSTDMEVFTFTWRKWLEFQNLNRFFTQRRFHVGAVMSTRPIYQSLLSSHQAAEFYRFFLYCVKFPQQRPAAAEASDAQQWPSVYQSKNQSHLIFLSQSSLSRPVQTSMNQKVASPQLGWFFFFHHYFQTFT